MTRTTGRRPYAPRMAPEQRREQLLDCVLRIIVRDGIHKVSMDSVAKEAGVTRPVVYGLFDDTDALLRASLDREERAVFAQLADVLPVPGAGDPGDAAVTSFTGFLHAVAHAPDRWRAVFMLVDSSTPAFRKRLEKGRRLIIGILEQLVSWAAEERGAPEVDVELVARALFALMWEGGRLVLAEPAAFTPERLTVFADRFIRLQLDQLANLQPASG